jgi:hypothetical protein
VDDQQTKGLLDEGEKESKQRSKDFKDLILLVIAIMKDQLRRSREGD